MSETLRVTEELTHDKLMDKFVREVEPRIRKRAMKGYSTLNIRVFCSLHSASKYADVIEDLGFEVSIYDYFAMYKLTIKW
ncbi:hypothetical protein [Staphylococcus cohnii]|uniref:hypothetical protein n=1 Tax=Staphylococcus cohnii TaxID=29382 RepID=UPI0007D8DA70|nr:hypothetical protein [Staphylococcus cohnii]OAO08706.1 hypothetical protein A4A82_10410 [Staphylococcus cohnii]